MDSRTYGVVCSNAALAMTPLGQRSGGDPGMNNLTDGSLTSTQSRTEHHSQQLGQSSQALTTDSGQYCALGGQSIPVIKPQSTLDIEEEPSILQSRVIWSPAQQLPAAMVVTGPLTPDMSTNSAECPAGLSGPRAGIMPWQPHAAAASELEAQPAGAASGSHAAVQRSASQELEPMTALSVQCGPADPWQPALQLHSQAGSTLQKPGGTAAPASASSSPSSLVRAMRPPSLHSVADAQPRPDTL